MGDAPVFTPASAIETQALHHVVVVGGGAGGLELVTKLGNTLGKRGRARITLVEVLPTTE